MSFSGADTALLKLVNQGLYSPGVSSFMLFVTDKHNWYPFIAVLILLLLVVGRKLPHRGNWFSSVNPRVYLLGLILAVAVSDQAAGLLKDSVFRIRPCRDPVLSSELHCPLRMAGRRSFPSNHAANAAAAAVFTLLIYPPAAVPALLMALLIGFSRVYLAVHYPSDVLAGWILGGAAGLLIHRLVRGRIHKPGLTGFVNMFRFRQHQYHRSPGDPWKDVHWRTTDGHMVTGWFLSGGSSVVVFVHGMGGSALSRVKLAEMVSSRAGCSFLLVPLRGSDGHPVKLTTGGVNEVHDVLGALQYLNNAGYTGKQIVLYGTSMGGISAVKACSMAGELLPAGLVVHGGFREFFLSAEHRTGRPGMIYLKALMPVSAVRNLKCFQPVYWLKNLKPELRMVYIYGDRDRVSPPDDGKLLAGATPVEAVDFRVLENRGHPTGSNTSDWEFAEILSGVVEECLKNETG